MKKLFFVFSIICLSGCSSITLHPISKADIFRIEKDATIINPSGEQVKSEKQGWFLSDLYVEQVMKASVK